MGIMRAQTNSEDVSINSNSEHLCSTCQSLSAWTALVNDTMCKKRRSTARTPFFAPLCHFAAIPHPVRFGPIGSRNTRQNGRHYLMAPIAPWTSRKASAHLDPAEFTPIAPSLHRSIAPSLHHSITPSLHHSITPSPRHSITPDS